MNKTELVSSVAEKSGLTKERLEKAVNLICFYRRSIGQGRKGTTGWLWYL